MSAQVNREEFIEYMEDTLREVYTVTFEGGTSWEQVFDVKESTKRREEVSEYTGPDVVIQTDEGTPYQRVQVRKAYTAATVHLTFTGEVKITHEMMRDNLYEEINQRVWGLADAMQRKIYKDAMQLFYNGFTSVLTPDGVSLYNTAHTLKFAASGVTHGNRNDVPLNSDTLFNAIADMLETKDENGSVSQGYGEGEIQLIVGPRLKKYAEELVGSDKTPDSNNNAINVYKKVFKITVVCLPLLAEAPTISATQWYLRDVSKARNTFFYRERPRTWMVKDQNSPSVLYQALCSYSFLQPTWRGQWGSRGQ
jgi:hypothetical protein